MQTLYALAATEGSHPHDPGSRSRSIAALLEEKGSRRYGLAAVSQLQHALQAALLAEQTGGDAALVTAALLHDIGHMVHGLGEDPAADGVDDRHEELGRAYLAALFGPAVTEPVRLHVAAKRYLCATEPDYFAKLSPDSVRSLALQGGPMSAEEVAAFRALPHSEAAVRLRRFDEGGEGRRTCPRRRSRISCPISGPAREPLPLAGEVATTRVRVIGSHALPARRPDHPHPRCHASSTSPARERLAAYSIASVCTGAAPTT